MNNKKRFIATAEEAGELRKNCEALKNLTAPPAFHYGWFFDTTGVARVEQINPRATYRYLFRTDQENKPHGT